MARFSNLLKVDIPSMILLPSNQVFYPVCQVKSSISQVTLGVSRGILDLKHIPRKEGEEFKVQL